MGVQVAMPAPRRQRPSDDGFSIGKALTIGGAVAGGIAGSAAGPGGALMGASAGGSLGGMVGGMVSPPSEAPMQQQGPQAIETGPLDRRKAQLDQSPLRQIRDSIDSLKYIQDDQTRVELAKPLVQAEIMAKRRA